MRNYTKCRDRQTEAMLNEQSSTVDPGKRKKQVQAIDPKLQQDAARVALYQSVSTACRHPQVKACVRAAKCIYPRHRMEDVWLDK